MSGESDLTIKLLCVDPSDNLNVLYQKFEFARKAGY